MTSNSSLNFNFSINLYEETRIFDQDVFENAICYISERFPPSHYPKLFEPGIGTGRIAIPLANKGYEVYGVDISDEMLNYLNDKLNKDSNKKLNVTYQNQDIVNLSFPKESFDIGIAVHLFYFIPNWQKAVQEIMRVLKKDAPIILMHTGMGMEVPELNEQYKMLCQKEGYNFPELGVKSTKEAVNYFKKLNYSIEEISEDWKWVSNIEAKQAIYYLKQRAYSFTSKTPDVVHDRVIKHLEDKHRNSNYIYNVPNKIYYVIVNSSDG